MTKLDNSLAYAESNRMKVCAIGGVLIALIAWADWKLPNVSIDFLYLIPLLLSAAALNRAQIFFMAALCGWLRESFDPLQWAPGAIERLLVTTAGYAMTGFFVAALNKRRKLLAEHLREREKQIQLRQEAELQVRILTETSPLAILTLDNSGRVLLANESARRLLGCEKDSLRGESVEPYLPILCRMLASHHSGNEIHTDVECRGHRRNGEIFLAHIWVSTYRTSAGVGLAAVVWDASEDLRDREAAGLDSMMATSRVLIGSISHEIRNLASAAASSLAALGATGEVARNEHYRALGTLISGLERIASLGLQEASEREAVVADLGAVLEGTRIVIEPSLRESGIEIVWEVAGGLPLVHAEYQSLLQVFVNLARNSQRALESCVRRQVRISAAVESELVIVRFRDTGAGVAHPEALFRPFQPGANSSGLGLYISRAILRSHGGDLRYEPEEAGACFSVELWPIGQVVGE